MSCSSQEPQKTEPALQNIQQSENSSAPSNAPTANTQAQQPSDLSASQPAGEIANTEPEVLSFPISEDLRILMQAQNLAYGELTKAITSYRRTEGSNPKTLEDLANSGLLLFWPRNVQTGKPASIFTGKELPKDFSGFGFLQYSRNADGFAIMNYLDPKSGRSTDAMDDAWETQMSAFPAKEVNDISLVEGCDVPLHSIDDPFVRKVIARVGQMTSLIIFETTCLYRTKQILPSTFNDILNPQELFIRENFQNFVETMKSPGVEFMWGNDYAKKSSYLYLKIKGKVYMEQCYDLGTGVTQQGTRNLKTCSFSELDTSSPILTSGNIEQLVIPDEYFVSIKDIPVSSQTN
jgi:hypothetical protein